MHYVWVGAMKRDSINAGKLLDIEANCLQSKTYASYMPTNHQNSPIMECDYNKQTSGET